MKKIISSLLILGMVFGCLGGFSVFSAEEAEGALYQQEIDFLKKAELLEQKFDTEAVWTKAEFAKRVIEFVNPGMEVGRMTSEEVFFTDVNRETVNYSYILACKQLGYISGDGKGQFFPDHPITFAEAVTILVQALHYDVYAPGQGGYPTGYLMTAKDMELTKEISTEMDTPVTGNLAAKLIYNALLVDYATVDSVSQNGIGITIDRDTNILKERHGIEQLDAEVIGNGVTFLGVSAGPTDRIVLESKNGGIYDCYDSGTGIAAYIGSRIYAYVKTDAETEEKTLIHFSVHPASKEMRIYASDILEMSKEGIRYEVDRETGKEAKVSFQDSLPVVIFNGMHMIQYDWSKFTPKDGFVRVVDNDGNGRHEIADIISFNYYSADPEKGTGAIYDGVPRDIVIDNITDNDITSRLDPALSISIDEQEVGYRLLWNPDFLDMEMVPIDGIMSVAEVPQPIDGKTFYYLVVNDQIVEGTLTSLSKNENKLTVNDVEYEISESLLNAQPSCLTNLNYGGDVTLYLDYLGKIANMETTGSSKNYAYLIGAVSDSGIENEVKVKVFLPDEGVQVLPLRSSVTIDGKILKTIPEQMQALQARPAAYSQLTGGKSKEEYIAKPITINVNGDGYVTMIDTETPNYPEDAKATNLYATMTPIRYSDSEVEDSSALKAGLRTPMTETFSVDTNSMNGKYSVSGKTVVIHVPDIDTFGVNDYTKYGSKEMMFTSDTIALYEESLEDENYYTMSLSGLDSNNKLDLQAYDIDVTTGVAGLVVVRGNANMLAAADWNTALPMSVFLRKTDFYDETTGELMTKLYYTSNGSVEQSAVIDYNALPFYYRYLIEGCTAEENPYGDKVIPAVQRGDIIRVQTAGDMAIHVERVSDLNQLDGRTAMTWYPYNADVPYRDATGRNDGFPFYQASSNVTIDSTYVVGSSVVKNRIGSTLELYIPKTTLGAIDPANPLTYSIQFVTAASSTMTITIKADGQITVKKGSKDDVVTTEQAGYKKASRFLFWHRLLSFNQMIIINDERL